MGWGGGERTRKEREREEGGEKKREGDSDRGKTEKSEKKEVDLVRK